MIEEEDNCMQKIFIYLISKWLKRFRPDPVRVLCCLAISLSLFGCQSYNNTARPRKTYICVEQIPHRGNPALIFDMPIFAHRKPTVSAEDFRRSEWPISSQATGHVSHGEVITYSEYRYDDQWIGGNSQPYQNFHRRLRGYRSGAVSR
jgi:hypothetical protein